MLDRTTKYAKAVLGGKIEAGRLVNLACERHLNDLKKSARKDYPYQFNTELAEMHLNFYNLCNHSKGKWAGQKIEPELWQCFCTGSAFGWVEKKTGRRRFRKVYEQVARKNGKSTRGAVTGLDCMSVDGEQGAEVYSAATTRDQAKIIFEEAQRMVKASPSLSAYIQSYKHNLSMPSTNSKFEPLSSDANTLDGLNVHAVLIDELHAHKTREVYDVMDTATGAREQPILWVLTTAGKNINGICHEVYDYAKKVLEGVIEDDRLFAYIAQIDESDNPFDESVWIKANPNLGVSVSIDDLRVKAKQAKEIPAAYNNFLCKHLNMWVSSQTAWINIEKWDACNQEFPDLRGMPCYCGVDLSTTTDITSVSFVFPLNAGYYAIINHNFMPEESITEHEHKDGYPYRAWVRDGYITATPGAVIDYEWIQSYIMEMSKEYQVLEICYDPWNATQFANNMTNEGFTCVEVRQGYRTMSEPIKDMEKLILENKLIHGGNPVLRLAVSNASVVTDPAGNVKLDKSKSTQRIDPIISAITAHVRAMLNPHVDLNKLIQSEEWGL